MRTLAVGIVLMVVVLVMPGNQALLGVLAGALVGIGAARGMRRR